MGFNERAPFNRHEERELDRELFINKAYEKALTSVHEAEIDPEKFRDLYGKEAVDADRAYIEEMERTFAAEGEPSEAQKLGTIFEALLHNQITYGGWFGKESSAQKTSRYDDVKNGIDEVVEIEVHEAATSYLGLALDATLGGTDEKFKRIKREIDERKLGTVKYFRSKRGEFRGELSHVPRVVVAADAKTVIELATLWLEKKSKELREHPFQHQVLEEIELQLAHFEAYARERGEEESSTADTFARSRAVIESIHALKKEEFRDDPKKRDGGLRKVRGHLSIFSVQEKEGDLK